MSKKQLPVFATANDFLDLWREVCTTASVDLSVMGLFDEAEPIVLTTPVLIRPLTSYLAFRKGDTIVSRPVRQRSGGIKFAIDPMVNPQSVVLRCGGRVDVDRLTAGDVSVGSNNDEAGALFAIFSGVIRQRFQKIKAYHVGSEAVRLFDEGIRLSPTSKSPPEYDLAR